MRSVRAWWNRIRSRAITAQADFADPNRKESFLERLMRYLP